MARSWIAAAAALALAMHVASVTASAVEPTVAPDAPRLDGWTIAASATPAVAASAPVIAMSTAAASTGPTPARSAPIAPRAASPCGPDALGPARTVTLDARGGPHLGTVEGFGPAPFLGPKEVVLTFDDGPRPRNTDRVLATLARHCLKATFFVIGRAARAHPEILDRVAAAGHTIAGHTETHPLPFDALTEAAAIAEIERGFATLDARLGRAPAPIFRFPGLGSTRAMTRYLAERDVIAMSVDVVSGDTNKGATVASIVENTMRRLERRGSGVLLFHDTLGRTATALPLILDRLKADGYRVVHVETREGWRPAGAPRGPRRPTPFVIAAPSWAEGAGPAIY